MKKVLYMHTGSGNRGCEAIIRTTSEILRGPKDLILWSGAKPEDEACGAARGFERVVVSEEIARYSLAHLKAFWGRRVLHQSDANLKVFLRELFRDAAAVSVGGDNYCYPWSAKYNAQLNREIRRGCKASVLWACSVDPEALTPEIREDLAGYDLITAREPLTYDLLKEVNSHVIRVADPAFLLGREDLPLPEGFAEGNTVGINVSPLIMQYGTESSVILENYRNLIRDILGKTDMNICLIPHVFWSHNDDMAPLRLLYDDFRETGRTCLITGGTAMQLKGYIARCRFFVGARTHATIAAYSTGVPTVVVGYSTKSRGIALDLFGTEEHYVLPVQGLKTEFELSDAFDWLKDHEKAVRSRLEAVMPAYREMARIPADLELFR